VTPSSASAATIISAADPAFRYEGRFDTTDAAAPVVIWQGSRISVDFEGDMIELRFGDVKGQVFFDATIDGRTTRVDLREGQAPAGASFTGLGSGRHTLTLFKRSEAAAGTVAFRAVTLAEGAKVHAPAAPHYALRMLFFGDSITAGANNEDGVEDQWDDRSTHNNAKCYARLTADAFSADYRNIAVSGMGVCEGYVPFPVKQIWDRVYPDPASPRADLTTWTPDVIFLNYGENDDSFTSSEKRPFPAAFTAEYVALVRSIRTAWPQAQIVILRGGMFGGSQSERLRGPWEAAVSELERSDAKIAHFAFEHWTPHHPRASDHKIMADALIAWLHEQPFMKR
jgi:lysophospholipase L1-like esterase